MTQPPSPRMAGSVTEDRIAPTVVSVDRVEAAYRQHSAKMWRAVLAYSGDPDVASDAVAEAFAQALRRDGAIRHVERWVWRAAFRIAAGELQSRRRYAASRPRVAKTRPIRPPSQSRLSRSSK